VSAVELVMLACCDLGGVVRGRSLPAAELGEHLQAGVGWVPANHALTPLGSLAEPNPFGPTGDLRLRPDPDTHTRLDGDGAASAFELVLCDIVHTDGAPWECCPRTFLRAALEDLSAELGVTLRASFEHEFQLLAPYAPALPFSLEAQRLAEPFASRVMGALGDVGAQPERFMPEFGEHQYEIPVTPAVGVAAADRSVTLKEVVREIARRCGTRASFAPLASPDGPGNGAHIHFSLVDSAGENPFYDAAGEHGLSELCLRFAAGILAHADALSALSAPSPTSAARLAPHHWSAGAVCLAARNREALLRIPPMLTLAGREPAPQLRLEYRAADGSANPYLVLGALVHAGLDGVRRELPAPPVLDRDPAQLEGEDAERFRVGGLPRSLEDALAALEQDPSAREWLSPLMFEAYVSLKRAEVEGTAAEDLAQRCARYARIY
jgi:glutamine synthetase